MYRPPVSEPGNSVSSDHVSPSSLEIIINEIDRVLKLKGWLLLSQNVIGERFRQLHSQICSVPLNGLTTTRAWYS